MKKRLLSILLAALMTAGTLPISYVSAAEHEDTVTEITETLEAAYASSSRASTVSRILTKEDFAYGGLTMVPSDLMDNEAFMNTYVRSGRIGLLNKSFKKVDSMNNGSGDTLPTGTIKGSSKGKWYVTYQWTPTAEERKAVEDGFLYFESGMIPDYHSHGFIEKRWEWSTSAIRITLPDENGNNTWEYGVNDYGRAPNGDTVYSDIASEKNDGQPQYVDSYAASKISQAIEKGAESIFFNAYQLWNRTCGHASVSGTMFYIGVGGGVAPQAASTTAMKKQRLIHNETYEITLDFGTEIRFADNQPHDNIKLYLDAEYLEQSGMNGDFQIKADFVEMTESTMTFRFKVDQKWKHFRINGVSSDQPDFEQETDLLVYDSAGNPLDAVKLTSDYIIADLYGNPMWSVRTYMINDAIGTMEFDGVSPTLEKVDVTGTGITVNAEEPDSWASNEGSRANIYAGTDGDTYGFVLKFSENITVKNSGNARAVLTIRDENGDPIELGIRSVSGNSIIFKSFTVKEGMLSPGQRIMVDEFKNLTVTDQSGNPLDVALTGNVIVPSQEIYLDVDAPVVDSDETLRQDSSSARRFSFPVSFADADMGADNSGVSGKSASFRLEIEDGVRQYPYKWYMDTRESISSSAAWRQGVFGNDNVIKDITDNREYWIHIELDPAVDYNYVVDNGVYFNGKLVVNGITDWAGNTGFGGEYDLELQVDDVGPGTLAAETITSETDFDNNSITFYNTIRGEDNYALSALYYQWELSVNGGDYEPIDDNFARIDMGTGALLKTAAAEVEPYTYTYDGDDEDTKVGSVRLKYYAEDTVGLVSDVAVTDAVSFDVRKALNNSTVEANSAANAVSLPDVTMQAPTVVGETANRSVSLLVIPDARSVVGGEYTEFWVWIPWATSESGWDSAYDVGNPVEQYVRDYTSGSSFYFTQGLYYHVTGSVDTVNAESDFGVEGDDGRFRLNRTADTNSMTEEELEELQAAQEDFYLYLTEYYGRMELYTVVTSSLDIENNIPDINFSSENSVLNTFTVYIMNNAEYSISDPVVLNEKGLSDDEIPEGEAKLDYITGEGRPARTNLNNVSVSIGLINESDSSSMGGITYGLEYIDFGNSCFMLFRTSSRVTDYDYLERWYISDEEPLQTWELVRSADGISTIVIGQDLCTENGWYTLALHVEDADGNVIADQIVTHFFLDTTVLDIEADSYFKSYSNIKDEYANNTIEWELEDLESLYENGEDVIIGLAPLPEDWGIHTELDGHVMTFCSYGRPDSPNDDGDESDDLAKVRVYNRTFNARAGLDMDEGLWIPLANDNKAYNTHEYFPYAADPETASSPYGNADNYLLPFVDGENLIVYEVMASNGLLTTKTMVIYVEADPPEWELEYDIEYAEEGTEKAASVTVWPVASDGSIFELASGEYDYVQGTVSFREYGEKRFADSCTYTNAVEDKVFMLIDELGNVSLRTLTIYGSDGEVLDYDNDPPYHSQFNSYTKSNPLTIDSYENGDTFHEYLYTYDSKSWIDINDIYLTFDAEYSAVLQGGEIDDEGRLTMRVPVALDENGEPLLDENGDYAVWESTDPIYNGVYRTKIRDYGGDSDNKGHVAVDIWYAWKYDESLKETTRTIWPTSIDSYGHAQDVDSNDVEKSVFTPGVCTSGYTLQTGALMERYNKTKDFDEIAIARNTLNEDGIVGFYSTVPFHSISGWGVGDAEEIEFYKDIYAFDREWADEGRYYYYTAPMIYKDGEYDFTVTDVYGKEYVLTLDVQLFGPPQVDVEFSDTTPTNQPVTVTFTALNEYDSLVSIIADDGTEGVIDSENPALGAITVEDNCTVTVTTELGYELKVRVTNIDKELEEATIIYYDQNYRPLDMDAGASEVIAVLSCTETIFATNGDETYVFTAGSVIGDTYTFEYSDLAGNTGSVTAVLPIDLTVYEEAVPESDTAAPDVTMGLYLYRMAEYSLFERIRNPVTDAGSGESELTSELNSEAYDGLRTRKYRLTMNIGEESAYKVLVVPAGTYVSADYSSVTEGSTVNGITMTSARDVVSLEITENTGFDVHVIDENGNMASFTGIRVTRISTTAPVLSVKYESASDENGYTVIRAVFVPDEADLKEEILPISGDIESMMTAEGVRYYHTFTANGTYTFEYMDSAGNRGSVTAAVNALSTESASVNSIAWYGTKTEANLHNVSPDKSAPVNKDITALLRMSKPISNVELYKYNPKMEDGFGELLDENSPVKSTFTGDLISVIYTENADYQVIVRYTASASGRSGTYILPAVNCIDKEAPDVTLETRRVSADKQIISFLFATDEDAVFTVNSEKGFAKTHSWICRNDRPVTLTFTDKAGNRTDYEVADFEGLDLVKLTVEYSASSDGADATGNPLEDLVLSVGKPFYIRVNKDVACTLGGTGYDAAAGVWTLVTLPDSTGIHIMKFTDKNTGSVTYQTVCALPRDTIAPLVTFDTDSVLVYSSASADEMMQAIRTGVTVTDNTDNAPTYTVTGYPASAAESGLYTLIYTASDASGNSSDTERILYILDEDTPVLLINDEVGLPFGKVYTDLGETRLVMQNITDGQPVVIKYRKGIHTVGQMKYYAETVENMMFETTERGHYTVYVRTQDRREMVTYLYVEE